MTVAATDVPDFLSEAHDRDPQILYRHLREQEPVFFHAGSNGWLVTRYDDILRILRSKDITSDNYSASIGTVYGRTLLQLDGKDHQQQRGLIQPIMTGTALANYRPIVQRVIDKLFMPAFEAAVETASRDGCEHAEIDLAQSYLQAIPISVILELLDLPRENRSDFIRWFKDLMAFVANVGGDPEPIERGLKARDELGAFARPLIAQRRAHPGEDLVSKMCHTELNGEGLTDEEVQSFITLMIVAGGETTERALGMVVLNLLRHPDQLAAVRADRSLVTTAFVETLRYSTPVNIASRTAAADIELHEVTIPAGSVIHCILGAGNRDPRKFSNPDEFNIFRQDNSTEKGFSGAADHLGFANGRHFCVGAALAKAEVEVGLNLILDHMKDVRIAEGFTPVETGLWTRGVDSLRVAFKPA
ncbi:cytochrome P450 [Sciscionella marina]|uniref:cytochrome P450 n=1 Tax=Sciscionella marina TaxID=508770 RepID=UPI00036895FF|nr:cytochrome P450 [Sciscionella marina]